jgi:hypothetical protein
MPIQLNTAGAKTNKEKLDEFRRTIKPGQAWSCDELTAVVPLNRNAISQILARNGWGVNQLNPANGRMAAYLVNPKDLKNYAKAN